MQHFPKNIMTSSMSVVFVAALCSLQKSVTALVEPNSARIVLKIGYSEIIHVLNVAFRK